MNEEFKITYLTTEENKRLFDKVVNAVNSGNYKRFQKVIKNGLPKEVVRAVNKYYGKPLLEETQ